MKSTPINRTGRFARTFGSKSRDWAGADVVQKIFGISRHTFLSRQLEREVLHFKGPVSRFGVLLGRAALPTKRALAEFIPEYSQSIRRLVYDRNECLRYELLNERDFPKVTSARATCFFFSDYDGHFQGPRVLLENLCTALGYARQGSDCRGSFQTPGAFVPRHCDAVDVLILQIFGARKWRVERNTVPPLGIEDPVRLPTRLRRGWAASFGKSSRVITLRPGSALFVPRAWWHETRSDIASFALTIGLMTKV